MPLENLLIDAPAEGAKLAANTLKEIWSVMDAASDKPAASQYLGEKAMRAVQGVTDQAQKAAQSALNAGS
jgi:hypothetical protein